MDFDLFSCTFEKLNNLKFNELQKLSSHFHVNKRWAKKREIIESLLSLRDKEREKRSIKCGDSIEIPEKHEDWVDGYQAFLAPETNPEPNEIDRRLTYTVTCSIYDDVDRRLTFNIIKDADNEVTSNNVSAIISKNIDRRLTYNANEVKGISESVKDSLKLEEEKKMDNIENTCSLEHNRALDTTSKSTIKTEHGKKFTLSEQTNSIQDKQNIDEHDPKSIIETSGSKIDDSLGKINKVKGNKTSKVKMLTIPYPRIPGQNRKSDISEMVKSELPRLKLLKKSNNMKDSSGAKGEITKLHEHIPQSDGKSTGIVKSVLSDSVTKNVQDNINNIGRRILPRRKSKTEDNILVQNLKCNKDLKFYSPKETRMNEKSSLRHSLETEKSSKSKIPKAKNLASAQKPITATKMPDFSKIHMKRFEQMDSLEDYKRKKEERARKLFGIPQPGIPIKMNKDVSNTIFQFKSSHNEKENKGVKPTESPKRNIQNVIKDGKGKPNRKEILNRAGSKSSIVTNLKEQRRKHLHGVRTNKRFELQMKFRKL